MNETGISSSIKPASLVQYSKCRRRKPSRLTLWCSLFFFVFKSVFYAYIIAWELMLLSFTLSVARVPSLSRVAAEPRVIRNQLVVT